MVKFIQKIFLVTDVFVSRYSMFLKDYCLFTPSELLNTS